MHRWGRHEGGTAMGLSARVTGGGLKKAIVTGDTDFLPHAATARVAQGKNKAAPSTSAGPERQNRAPRAPVPCTRARPAGTDMQPTLRKTAPARQTRAAAHVAQQQVDAEDGGAEQCLRPEATPGNASVEEPPRRPNASNQRRRNGRDDKDGGAVLRGYRQTMAVRLTTRCHRSTPSC